MVHKWIAFDASKGGANRQKLPKTHHYVLCLVPVKGCPAAVVLGYLKYHAGVKSEPYFVTPGFSRGEFDVTHWIDCLGDDFSTAIPHNGDYVE